MHVESDHRREAHALPLPNAPVSNALIAFAPSRSARRDTVAPTPGRRARCSLRRRTLRCLNLDEVDHLEVVRSAAAGSNRRTPRWNSTPGPPGHSNRCIPKEGRLSSLFAGRTLVRLLSGTVRTHSDAVRQEYELAAGDEGGGRPRGIHRYGSAQIEAPYSLTTRSNADVRQSGLLFGVTVNEREVVGRDRPAGRLCGLQLLWAELSTPVTRAPHLRQPRTET